MRLSGKTVLFLFLGLAVFSLFSCKTQQPSHKGFDRIAFGEKLEKLLSDGKYDQALALFDSVPEPDASSSKIQMLKLSIMLSSGKIEESTAKAKEMETAFPDNTDVLYIQALLAGARNDTTQRTAYLNKILKLEPENTQALTGIGLDLFARKNYPLAKTYLLKAVAADANNTEALLGLARVYYMQAELVKAGDTLNLAIKKNPEMSVLWAERARVKSETNDLPGALEDISYAIKLDAGIYSQWIDYGTYLISSAKKDEARKAFTEAINLEPDSYLAYIYRAGINDELGFIDEAISDNSAICRLYPQYYFASESLGVLLWGKGDYEGSRAAFLQALGYSPKNSSYALMYTLACYRLNKDAEAKAFMSKYMTTLDRTTTEYFVCRLFVDRSGDPEVLGRVMKEANDTVRTRLLFYMAEYYELFQSKSIALKYYVEVLSVPAPSFFEYRICQWAKKTLEGNGTNP